MMVLHWSELEVFKKAHYPKEKLFGTTSKLRRAAFPIPVNIVEGNKMLNSLINTLQQKVKDGKK